MNEVKTLGVTWPMADCVSHLWMYWLHCCSRYVVDREVHESSKLEISNQVHQSLGLRRQETSSHVAMFHWSENSSVNLQPPFTHIAPENLEITELETNHFGGL